MDCPEAIDLMGDALEGELATHSRAGFEEHLEECAKCRNYWDQLRVTRRALQELGPTGETSPYRSQLIARYREGFEKRS